MSAQSSPEGPLPAKDSQLLFAAGESPTVEAAHSCPDLLLAVGWWLRLRRSLRGSEWMWQLPRDLLASGSKPRRWRRKSQLGRALLGLGTVNWWLFLIVR